ncbi:MAG: metallophosphoesterase family protein [Chitinispirillaceae bacterium]|nr:metallophosphoesterase family protein [Chitinispirillaceae bacterium]
MRKSPYLIYPNRPAEMTVLWQMENSATCQLRWGTTPACSTGRVLTTETGQTIDEHQHIHTLSELTPNRLYYYQVVENGVIHHGTFRSAPPDTADSTSFFIYGDTRTYPQMHDSVLSGICHTIRNAPSRQTILLHTGDWTASSWESYWDMEYFNRAYPHTLEVLSKIPVLGAIGNHEVEGDETVYRKYWPYPYERGGFYYAFDYGPVHISVIDQYSDYSPGSEQFQWLENDLAWSDKQWKFILLHEPGFSDEGAHGNNFQVQIILHPLCLRYGVSGVFSGHNHFYAHCTVDGVHHLTLGGGGAPLYQVYHTGKGLITSETSLHYAYVNVRPDSAAVAVIRPDGTVVEEFSIVETPEPPLPIPKKTALFDVYTLRSLKLLVVETVNYKNATVTLLDVGGRMMLNRKLMTPRTVIDLAAYPRGVYVTRVATETSAVPAKIVLF